IPPRGRSAPEAGGAGCQGERRDRLLAAGKDEEQLGERRDVEQAPYLARDAAQGEPALHLGALLRDDEQGPEARAADVRDVAEVEDQQRGDRFDELRQAVPERPRARAVDASPERHRGDGSRLGLGDFHAPSLSSYDPRAAATPSLRVSQIVNSSDRPLRSNRRFASPSIPHSASRPPVASSSLSTASSDQKPALLMYSRRCRSSSMREIGRASCRERGETQGGERTLNTKVRRLAQRV